MDYDEVNETTYNTEVLKSNLCYYNDAYVLVIENITVIAVSATQVAFKDCAPFSKSITKTAMMKKQWNNNGWCLKFRFSHVNVQCVCYSETRGSLWIYPKDKATNFNNNIANTDNFKFLKYRAKLLENKLSLLQMMQMEF